MHGDRLYDRTRYVGVTPVVTSAKAGLNDAIWLPFILIAPGRHGGLPLQKNRVTRIIAG